MITYLYSSASFTVDNQDAALLCLLWFLFGRASDLTQLRKANLSICSGDIFFVRFIRVTSEEQGLFLFPDEDFSTCPLIAIALALASQSSPTTSLLSQLPMHQAVSRVHLTPATPLINLMDHPEYMPDGKSSNKQPGHDKTCDGAPGIHSYVNRILDKVAERAGVSERLRSHPSDEVVHSMQMELEFASSGSSTGVLGT
ncbi:unnamed protein product [Phytophthora fragariaefolia]|uniref:Unnamed protein product n=1 Tax=Phytophthora fragariaefolia TaxID=1490495 RepID=A0A9W6XXD5_9STRA|nr:unnamed protein product [Phytophthora fragariaefolia]